MRYLVPLLCAVFLFCLPGMAQGRQTTRAWNKHEGSIQGQMNSASSTQEQQHGPDLAELQREAGELTGLSQSVSADIDALRKGLLAKDLDEKLKRIEKLSKKLRIQIAPPLN